MSDTIDQTRYQQLPASNYETGETKAPRKGEFVQSLARGLTVLGSFSGQRQQMTLSEVAREANVPRAVARRFLRTLVSLDYVRTDGRLFYLTPKVLNFGSAYLAGLRLPEIAQPHVSELAAQAHEAASLGVLDRDEVVYVLRVPGQRIVTIAISVGTRLPAYATSTGQVLLASLAPNELDEYLSRVEFKPLGRRTVATPQDLRGRLAKVREAGHALTHNELEDGILSLAVPILDPHGNAIAAISIGSNELRTNPERLRSENLPHVAAAAARISADWRASNRHEIS